MLRNKGFALAAIILLLSAIAAWASGSNTQERPRLGLFSTLPIYWGEVGGMEEMLSADAEPHWARGVLEEDFRLIPLDALLAAGEDEGSLDKFDLLIMAQPRALSAKENVALDDWVRAGGRVLIFADPMLTGHSRFSIGDRRRAQDVVLLSPILRRWSMDLLVDDGEQPGERMAALGEVQLTVNLPGRLVARPTDADAPSACSFAAKGLMADCAIGEGRAIIVADAAVLESHDGEVDEIRVLALAALSRRAFDSP